MTSLQGHRTKTELAVHVLRERIRTGELPPGHRLRLESLRDELGMSPTPIREALRLLQADGLVDYRPHHGIVVAELAPQQVLDLVRIRVALESLATELALPRLGEEGLARLERLHERYLAATASGRGTAITAANQEWHWAIYEASGNELLGEFVRRSWEPYPWRTIWAVPGRIEAAAEEHEQVMDAVRRDDVAGAAALMRAHLESSADALLDRLGLPAPADGGGGTA